MKELLIAVASATPAKQRRIWEVLNDNGASRNETVAKRDMRLVTISGTAKLLALGRNTVYKLIAQGRLETRSLTGVPRVTMQSIFDFLDGKNPENDVTASMIEESKARYAANKAKGGK